jgi:hypothetical protein
VAEGGGLLNRYTVKSCIGGSNPPLSAISSYLPFIHRFAGRFPCIKVKLQITGDGPPSLSSNL